MLIISCIMGMNDGFKGKNRSHYMPIQLEISSVMADLVRGERLEQLIIKFKALHFCVNFPLPGE